MTATLAPVAKMRFFNQAGAPLSGGFVYTYAGGTLTPKITYVDEAGVTQNANPIVLDPYGECDLWLAPGESYKFILKDSLGNLQWTVDDIIGIGTMGLQNADNVNIIGGNIGAAVTFAGSITGNADNVTGVVQVDHGGTGGTTQAAARAGIAAAASGANTDITSLASSTTINGNSIGYRDIPSNPQVAAYQITADDAGKSVDITTGGVTIPSNAALALPIGFTFSVYNNSAANQTMSITTDTMYLAGTATTGARTLAQRGVFSARKVAATTWVCWGAGVT